MHRLGFHRHPPTEWGIRKVLMAIDVAALEHCLMQWLEHVLHAARKAKDPQESPTLEGLSLDGKSCRGSFDGLSKAVHLLSVVAQELGLTIAQSAVPNGGEDKTNEHKTSLKLLKGLVLEGRIVTGDAMFCHRDVCEEILERKGEYFLFVKENQPTLLRDIQAVLAPPPEGAFL